MNLRSYLVGQRVRHGRFNFVHEGARDDMILAGDQCFKSLPRNFGGIVFACSGKLRVLLDGTGAFEEKGLRGAGRYPEARCIASAKDFRKAFESPSRHAGSLAKRSLELLANPAS